MDPAYQRFGSHSLAIHIDLQLIIQLELLLLQRDVQVCFHPCMLGYHLLHLWIKELQCITAHFFRFIHRNIGLLQGLIRSPLIAAKQGYPDTRGVQVFLSLQHIGLIQFI